MLTYTYRCQLTHATSLNPPQPLCSRVYDINRNPSGEPGADAPVRSKMPKCFEGDGAEGPVKSTSDMAAAFKTARKEYPLKWDAIAALAEIGSGGWLDAVQVRGWDLHGAGLFGCWRGGGAGGAGRGWRYVGAGLLAACTLRLLWALFAGQKRTQPLSCQHPFFV